MKKTILMSLLSFSFFLNDSMASVGQAEGNVYNDHYVSVNISGDTAQDMFYFLQESLNISPQKSIINGKGMSCLRKIINKVPLTASYNCSFLLLKDSSVEGNQIHTQDPKMGTGNN